MLPSETNHFENDPGRVPPVLDNPPVPPQASARAWGFWATMGLGFTVIAGMILSQAVGIVLFALIMKFRGQHLKPEEMSSNGLALSLAGLCSLPVTFGLCWLFAHLKQKRRAAEYLAFKRVGWRFYAWGFSGFIGILLIWAGMVRLFNLAETPPCVIEAYRTAEIYPLLWFAVIIAAPVMEETLFRGFFFQGFVRSRAGVAGAILIPSLFWAVMHVQYGIHEIALIFLGGILLGMLRLKSGSILPGMLVHAVYNLLSTVEVALLVGS